MAQCLSLWPRDSILKREPLSPRRSPRGHALRSTILAGTSGSNGTLAATRATVAALAAQVRQMRERLGETLGVFYIASLWGQKAKRGFTPPPHPGCQKSAIFASHLLIPFSRRPPQILVTTSGSRRRLAQSSSAAIDLTSAGVVSPLLSSAAAAAVASGAIAAAPSAASLSAVASAVANVSLTLAWIRNSMWAFAFTENLSGSLRVAHKIA